MAIRKISLPQDTTETDTTAIAVMINNGDFKLLTDIQRKWKFKNQEDILRFALAVLFKAETKKVIVESKEGSQITIVPNDDLFETMPTSPAPTDDISA